MRKLYIYLCNDANLVQQIHQVSGLFVKKSVCSCNLKSKKNIVATRNYVLLVTIIYSQHTDKGFEQIIIKC